MPWKNETERGGEGKYSDIIQGFIEIFVCFVKLSLMGKSSTEK